MLFKPALLRLTVCLAVAAAFSVSLFASDEADVRAALMNYTHAIESMNLDRTMDCYADTPEVSVSVQVHMNQSLARQQFETTGSTSFQF